MQRNQREIIIVAKSECVLRDREMSFVQLNSNYIINYITVGYDRRDRPFRSFEETFRFEPISSDCCGDSSSYRQLFDFRSQLIALSVCNRCGSTENEQ